MARNTILLILTLLLAFTSILAQPSGLTSTASQNTNALPVSPHEKFATFLAGDFKSLLLLENLRPDVPITFAPALILSHGEVPLDSVTVSAHSTATVDIGAVLRDRGYPDTRGTVVVRFQFASYGPGSAVVEMRDDKHHLYLNSYAQSPEEYWSGTSYDAVVWAPHEGTEGFIAITNGAAETHVVRPTFIVDGRSEQQGDMQLLPRQTRILSINDLLTRSRKSGAGIHIEYTQEPGEEYPGAILVEGQIFNKKTGFTKHIHFMDKALPPTGILRTHFLLLGHQPVEDNFPSNISFRSVAAVRNIDGTPVTVTPTVKFFQSGSLHSIKLPSRLLAPAESWLIDFDAEQKSGHLPPGFFQGSLELAPDVDRASIVGELFNFSDAGGYVVGPSMSSYPSRSTASIWRTDGSFQTTIMVENTADKDDRVALHLYSDRRSYTKTFTVSAEALLKVNVRDLQQKGIPDDSGNLLLDTSGVMSLVGSHNTHSKLSYDKIIHNASQSDYVGLPPTACDFVQGIFMFPDLSRGSQPFPVMMDYDWSISGPQNEAASGSTVSDSSLAQISNSGSGDMITFFMPPDDGATHTVTIFPPFPEQVVTNCVACSYGDVIVLSSSVGLRISHAGWGPPPSVGFGSCVWDNFACSSGTAYCQDLASIVIPGTGCPNYARSRTLVAAGICIPPSITVAATGPSRCD